MPKDPATHIGPPAQKRPLGSSESAKSIVVGPAEFGAGAALHQHLPAL